MKSIHGQSTEQGHIISRDMEQSPVLNPNPHQNEKQTRRRVQKRFACVVVLLVFACAANLYAVEEGFMWTIRANFNGTATLPSISDSDLSKLSAAYMEGMVGYSMDGEVEIGYLFGSRRWFHIEPDIFSGVSLFGSIGVGNGFAGQVAGNTVNGNTVNMYVQVNYTPVITFGVGSEAYFLNSRISCGLWLGGKMVAALSPEYLAYADDPAIEKDVGRIVVTDFMKKNMNPLMFSMKTMVSYHQPLIEHMEMTVGGYMRMNIWKPNHITIPDKLQQMIPGGFNIETPLPSFYLNSLDFGVSVGLTFKA